MRKASTPASAATNREAFYAQRRRIRSETKLEIGCRQQILEYFCEVSCNRDLADRIAALATHDPKSGCATAIISRNEIDAAADEIGDIEALLDIGNQRLRRIRAGRKMQIAGRGPGV